MSESGQAIAPPEVLEAYFPQGIVSEKEIKGGEVNTTLLVTDNVGNKNILQRLSKIFDTSVEEDYAVVSSHLTELGWEMATVLKTDEGTACLTDGSGNVWRVFSYIESDPGSNYEGDLEASVALGGLLGTLHSALATLDYVPKFRVPHSQDTDYYRRRLLETLPYVPDEVWELAQKMIETPKENALGRKPVQLIHGDPRIGNSLFIRNKPFTFIDWDGFKIGSPLLDVGDMLQSTAGEVITKGKGDCTVEDLLPMLEAYFESAGVDTDKESFILEALSIGRIIALNLGMRHLIDTVEDRYFKWDTSRFKSRLAFNIYCASRQQKVAEIFEAS